MSQSLSKLFIHLVFHVKNYSLRIREKEEAELYAYKGAIIKDNDSVPIIINGDENHVHIFCIMSENIARANLIEEIKRHSSRWIKTKNNHYLHFAWQAGYGGFSVSPSLHDKTKMYV